MLIGGEGADTLVGGDGVDRADYAYSTVGLTVNLATGVASDGDALSTIENVTGSKFNDALTGDAGVNVLDGGAGDDVLAGGAGADRLVGGDGIDTADYSSFAVSVTVNLATGANSDGDTLSSIENLTGSKLDDLLTGDAGANVLDGGAGNDVLIGGAGADVLTGGDGVDLADYSGSGAGVTVDLAAGTGLGGDAQGDTLSGVENILGSKFDDVIIGDGSANTVKAGSGNDYVDGGAGNDVIYGGDGDDTLTGNYGTDKMYGEGGNDTFLAEWDEGQGDYYNGGDGVDTYKIDGTIFQNYSLQIDLATGTDQYHDTFISVENLIGASAGDAFYGDAGVNQFWGRDGNDVLDGRGGNDNLFGENGDDTLAGGDGNDVLDGGAGNDTLAGGASGDKLIGGDGVDTLDYSASNAAVAINLTNGTATGGDAEGDVFDSVENVTGSKFDDVLNGNEGSNVLDGGEGNDVLSGGAGADKLVGGNGVDTADYSSSAVGVTVNLTTGANSDGDTLVGIENVTGTVFDDVLSGDVGANTLIGGDGNDILLGDAGADLLIGGDGIDVADYSTSAVGVYINLATGVNHGGDAEGDVLVGIENLKGSAFDDVLIGSAETTNLDGGGGNDVLDYSLSLGGVTVNIATNFAFGGFATGDVISNFENLRGSASADDLSGNNGANQIFGGAGNDTISGGAGADVIDGGEGSDTVDYSSAVAGVTVNLATGANSDGDTLVSIENVKGSKFNDVISGDVQANILDGGDGFDTLDYSASSAAIIVNLANNTVTSNLAAGDTVFNFEAINGSGFADTMTGDATANFLYGLAGNDTLYGGLGNDTLGGGDGNDRIYGGDGSDIVDGGLGTDTADYRYSAAAITVSLLTNTGLGGEAAGDQLISIENLSGSNFDDVLTGDAGVNRLVGRLGNDVLNGGAGNDYLDGGSGIDVLNGGDGIDTAEYTDSWAGVTVNLLANTGVGGEAKGDTFISIENVLGSQFDDIITGNAVNNRLNGDAGNDTLNGGDGNDMLVGGTGADTLIGGAGDQDAAVYDTAASAVIVNLATGGTGGEAAGDTYNGVEYVIGSTFGDTITGDVAINRLMGGAGNDRIDGAAGNDYLLGEAGNDMLIGGAGADVFVFDKSFGKDTISDFWAGVGRTDRVWITNTDIHSFADVLSHSVDSAAGVVFTISTQDSITFTGLTVAQLHADDFIFV